MQTVKILWVLVPVALLLGACPTPSDPEPDTEITLVSIAISRPPDKQEYAKGEDFDSTGLEVRGTYSDGSTRAETGYTLSGIDMNSTGDKTVTVSLGEKTATFTITVGPAALVSITISRMPDKTSYVTGEAFNPAGLEVMGTYTDKTTKVETDYALSNPDMTGTGEKTVTVSLEGKSGLLQENFTILVETSALVSISIRSPPAKQVYPQGEAFDPAGLEVEGHYGDGSTHMQASYTLTGAVTDSMGEKTVTVTVNNLSATFTITVTEAALVSIAISRRPDKTSYAKGETLDPAGLRVTGTYTNGSTKQETGYTLSAPDMNSMGEKTVTVSLKGFTATFTITVREAALASIAISKLPDKTVYIKGETFDPAGLEISGTYTDGTTKKEETGYALSSPDMNSTGEKQVRVSLKGKSATFTITVNPALLASIAVTKEPIKRVYTQGTAFVSAGLEVTGTYTDKTTKRETGYTVAPVDTDSAGIKTVTVSLQGQSATFSIAVVKPALYFDYGRRRSPSDHAEPGRYSVPLGRTLVLAPVRWYVSDTASYTWTVNSTVQSAQGEYFSFTPNATGTYTIKVSTEGVSAATASVVCVAAEGTYLRAIRDTSKARVTACFEFTPAPGQFVDIPPGTTEEGVRLDAQATVDSNTGGTSWAWSLGAWGGYVVTGFDHSVANTAGYDLAIYGNPLESWSEPGTVWVMQDENGNGKPDDTWYELEASETGKSTTKQRYAVTYYKPQGNNGPLWVDNLDTMGSFPARNYYGESQGYPYSVPGDWVTFVGTRLPNTLENGQIITNPGFPGPYVDNRGSTFFKISDAIQVDGSPVQLKYIDFVKVQTAVNNYAGVLGEVSTETSLPFDYALIPSSNK